MKKRIAAVIAAGLMAFQLTATGTAFAATDTLGSQEISLGGGATSQCVFAGGIAFIQSSGDADVYTDNTYLHCDVVGQNGGHGNHGNGPNSGDEWSNSSLNTGDNKEPLLAEVKSIQIIANGDVTIFGWAQDDSNDITYSGSGLVKPANFGGKATTVDAYGNVIFDASGIDGLFGVNVKATTMTFSGFGLSGKFLYGEGLEFYGGSGADTFDASGVTVLVPTYAEGYDGGDTLKGGAGVDEFIGEEGSDKLYGNAGDDELDCSGDTGDNATVNNTSYYTDQCWGGAGDDSINVGGQYLVLDSNDSGGDCDNSGDNETCPAADTVAPGDGYDYIFGTGKSHVNINYSDSTSGIDTSLLVDYDTTGGQITTAADFDFFTVDNVLSVTGSKKADAIWMYDPVSLAGVFTEAYGGGGKDIMKGTSGADFIDGGGGADTINARGGNDEVRGRGGDDVIYGSKGDDMLYGGKGADQTWGGKGVDSCAGEVQDRCEFSIA